MQKKPKRQHYLPVSYLKFFSQNPNENRKARIFRYDGVSSTQVPVESQCYGKFHYSSAMADLVEAHFGVFESKYPTLIKKLINGDSLSKSDYYFFILIIFDIHMRNIAYRHHGFANPFKGYQQLRDLFFERVIAELPLQYQLKPNEYLFNAFVKKWRLSCINTTGDDFFITSDHPCLWFDVGGYKPVFMILPITPRIIALAYDVREVEVVEQTAHPGDISVVNFYQCRQSLKVVYSQAKLTSEQEKVASSIYNKIRSKHGDVFPEYCYPDLFTYWLQGEPLSFTFLKIKRDENLLFPTASSTH